MSHCFLINKSYFYPIALNTHSIFLITLVTVFFNSPLSLSPIWQLPSLSLSLFLCPTLPNHMAFPLPLFCPLSLTVYSLCYPSLSLSISHSHTPFLFLSSLINEDTKYGRKKVELFGRRSCADRKCVSCGFWHFTHHPLPR